MSEKRLIFGYCDRCFVPGTGSKKVRLAFRDGYTIVYCPRCGRHIYGHQKRDEK